MLNALWTVDISINTAYYIKKKERKNETHIEKKYISSLSVVRIALYMENLFMLHKTLFYAPLKTHLKRTTTTPQSGNDNYIT